MLFGGVCFIGPILVLFAVTMSRKHCSTRTTQTVLRAPTANIPAYEPNDAIVGESRQKERSVLIGPHRVVRMEC